LRAPESGPVSAAGRMKCSHRGPHDGQSMLVDLIFSLHNS
jgi:hypothetical protein